MRTDQDLNGGPGVQTQWSTVQRAIEQYREYILQVGNESSSILTIYPDMDNLFVGNNASRSGLTDNQRQTVMSHWIGAGANLIIGSNMTELDSYGLALLTNELALKIANNFTAKYPMRPTQGNRNPSRGRQGQVWIAGPADDSDSAVVVVANYGNSGNNDLFDPRPTQGWWSYNFTFSDIGLDAAATYAVEDVWNSDADFTVQGDEIVSGTLQDAAVKFWRLTKRNKWESSSIFVGFVKKDEFTLASNSLEFNSRKSSNHSPDEGEDRRRKRHDWFWSLLKRSSTGSVRWRCMLVKPLLVCTNMVHRKTCSIDQTTTSNVSNQSSSDSNRDLQGTQQPKQKRKSNKNLHYVNHLNSCGKARMYTTFWPRSSWSLGRMNLVSISPFIRCIFWSFQKAWNGTWCLTRMDKLVLSISLSNE